MPSARRFLSAVSFAILAQLTIMSMVAEAGPLSLPDQSRVKVWIYFSDHGEASHDELRDMLARVSINERAQLRRTRRSRSKGPDAHDLAVNAAYVDAVRETGSELRHESRYLNAVSAWTDAEQLRAIAGLPFVRRIDRVRTGKRAVPEADPRFHDTVLAVPHVADDLDYGISDAQHRMINTKPLHAEGYAGRGVRIAVFDTGFFRSHNGLAHLNVIAEWDFINDDGITADQAHDIGGQMAHGTSSLGILASYWPGVTMGVAWEAEYILAKTERLMEEVESEEDNYVAALEWADGLGVDVVSSSLGYLYWYDREDMDGDTAVVTKAVDIAASRGILVVTAAGNQGNTAWSTIIAPADADSAIAVGMVDLQGVVPDASSRGPTYDGRIKPDVVAQGLLVATLNWQSASAPAAGTGTSAATPLVAGAAALALQKHPDWSPIDVRDALRATASRADTPDNAYGWGIIDAYAAANHGGVITATIDVRPGSCDNPFNPKSRGVLPALLLGSVDLDVHAVDTASLRLAGSTALRATVVDAAGNGDCAGQSPDGRDDLLIRFDSEEIAASMTPAAKGEAVTLALTGALHDGTTLAGEAVVRIVGGEDRSDHDKASEPGFTSGLGAAVPNPFNPITRISYSLAHAAPVELVVYDIRGRLVATLVDNVQPAGRHVARWDAAGHASGVYFYRLRSDGVDETRKLVLLK